MTRMLGMFTAGLAVIVVATPGAKAGGYYFGVQFGHQPRAHAHHQRAYSAPSAGYGYAPSAGYAPMMMMAPSAGCSGLGYSPMLSPGGCSGSGLAYGYAAPSYGYGYAAPGYGYAAPQSGILSFGGGLLEALELARQIRTKLDDFGGGGAGSREDIKKLTERVEGMDTRLKAITIPPNLDTRLKAIDDNLLKLNNETLPKLRSDIKTDIDALKVRLKALDGKDGG